jgi:hypothetical protein
MDNIHTTQSETGTLENLSSVILTGLLVACVVLVYWLCIVK